MDDVVPLVGDRDRRLVDERLQSAVGDGVLTLGEYDERAARVWQARTRADLDAVTHDLPAGSAGPGVPLPASGSARLPEDRKVVAVLSGDRLSGPVAPGQAVAAYAVLGNAEIDLRREDLPPELRLRAVAVLGNVEVLVPRGVTVQVRGSSVLGSRDVQVDPGRPGGSVVHLDAQAVLGSVQVHHGHERAEVAVSLTKGDRGAGPAVRGPRPPAQPHGPWWHRRGRVLLALGLAVGLAVGVPAVATADQRSVFGSGRTQVERNGSADVAVLFGSYEVVVPDDATVVLNGTMVFGSSECKNGCSPDGAGADVVHVHARGAFGSVDVVREADDKGSR